MSSNVQPLRPNSSTPTCCVLVLTYNGRSHLENCPPSPLRAAPKAPGACPHLLVYNRSPDEIGAWLRRYYPEVEILIAEGTNFLLSLSRVVASGREDVVVIVN